MKSRSTTPDTGSLPASPSATPAEQDTRTVPAGARAAAPVFRLHTVNKLAGYLASEDMIALAGRLTRHIRRLGSAPVHPGTDTRIATFIVEDGQPMREAVEAHALLFTAAQIAALEIHALEQEDPLKEGRHRSDEMTGLAFLAETSAQRGMCERLFHSLEHLARHLAVRCHESLGATVRMQFVHGKGTRWPSPVEEKRDVPLAAYRIRFQGCSEQQVLNLLAEGLQTLPPAPGRGDRRDVLVINNVMQSAP